MVSFPKISSVGISSNQLNVHIRRTADTMCRYIVAFRSKRAEGSVDVDLYTADREAHEEAVTQGGLLAYCEFDLVHPATS